MKLWSWSAVPFWFLLNCQVALNKPANRRRLTVYDCNEQEIETGWFYLILPVLVSCASQSSATAPRRNSCSWMHILHIFIFLFSYWQREGISAFTGRMPIGTGGGFRAPSFVFCLFLHVEPIFHDTRPQTISTVRDFKYSSLSQCI